MRKITESSVSGTLLALLLLGVSACAKHEEPAPIAALPPPLPPPPAPPAAPSPDDQLQRQLSNLGAAAGNGGWSLTLSSARFRAGKVTFSSEEQVTLEKIVTLVKQNQHLRMQIENYLDKRGAKARIQQLSQMQANAVLRDLESMGADEARIQSQGEVDTSRNSRIEIVFSNANGEFNPAPTENS